jgi:hypothetical protein
LTNGLCIEPAGVLDVEGMIEVLYVTEDVHDAEWVRRRQYEPPFRC